MVDGSGTWNVDSSVIGCELVRLDNVRSPIAMDERSIGSEMWRTRVFADISRSKLTS